MSSGRKPPVSLILVVAAGWAAGCSRFPDPPKAPDLSPAAAAAKAIEQYDSDGDGKISGAELDQSPPLKVAAERIDTDKDGALSAGEIEARIASWADAGTIVTSGTVVLTLDGAPLAGATVTFEPEEFLGPAFEPCKGVADGNGYASVSREDSQFPGIYLGFYRVKISKQDGGREIVPAKYNEQTELGYEAATDLEGIGTVNFALSSR